MFSFISVLISHYISTFQLIISNFFYVLLLSKFASKGNKENMYQFSNVFHMVHLFTVIKFSIHAHTNAINVRLISWAVITHVIHLIEYTPVTWATSMTFQLYRHRSLETLLVTCVYVGACAAKLADSNVTSCSAYFLLTEFNRIFYQSQFFITK